MDFHGLIWLIVFALTIRYGLPWFFSYRRKQRLAAAGIVDIDAMDGLVFEQYLEVLFGKLGYNVERTRYVGDYGADLITHKDGVKTVIQAKRYKKSVGIKSVQEAVAAKGMYGCTGAMVVTNSTFTRAAVELAKANHVVLWDRDRLVETILQVQGETKALPAVPQPLPLKPVLPDPLVVAGAHCATCGVKVSEKVRQYCSAHPQRFTGRTYCFEHQKAVKHHVA